MDRKLVYFGSISDSESIYVNARSIINHFIVVKTNKKRVLEIFMSLKDKNIFANVKERIDICKSHRYKKDDEEFISKSILELVCLRYIMYNIPIPLLSNELVEACRIVDIQDI